MPTRAGRPDAPYGLSTHSDGPIVEADHWASPDCSGPFRIYAARARRTQNGARLRVRSARMVGNRRAGRAEGENRDLRIRRAPTLNGIAERGPGGSGVHPREGG